MQELVSGLYFSVLLLAIITLFDVFIKFKRPVFLKILLLIIVFNNGLIAIINIFFPQHFYLFMVIFRLINGACAISFFNLLYFPKMKNWIYFFFTLVCIFLFFYIQTNIDSIQAVLKGPIKIGGKIDFIYPKQYIILRLLLLILFIGGSINLYYGIRKRKDQNIYFQQTALWSLFNLCLLLITGITYIFINYYTTSLQLNRLVAALINIAAMIIVLYRPVYLNNYNLKFSLSKVDIKNFSNQQVELFLFEFYSNHYYLNKEATLEEFAAKINVDKNDLYRFVFDKYLMSFSDLINKNRIDYFLQLISKRRFMNYSIEDLAIQAGFNSRQHLYKPFKKFHGGSPTDLIDSRTL